MNKSLRQVLKVVLWGALALFGLYIVFSVAICLRYSPEYVYRDIFWNLGTVYDYRLLPERKLSASSTPFRFSEDVSNEPRVLEAFRAGPGIQDLEAFLADTSTQAFLVIQDDVLIYERYFMGFQRDSIVTSYSVAKSFDSAMIGIAIAEGYINSVDDPITDTIPELIEGDARFQDITIKHLLSMASGIRYVEERLFFPADDSLTYGFDDLRHLALTETEIVDPPGVNFLYNNYNPLLLGLILERATGVPVTTYLQEKLWTPLGMEYDGSWSLDSEATGFEKMESGINARAIDFAKLGRLYMKQGNWNGTQIVPAEWVAQSIQDNGLFRDAPVFYGYMWWGKNCNPQSQDFFALGNMGQFVYVSPAKNLIIVRNGEGYGLEGEQAPWVDMFCQFAQALP
jgi:CubicO group peptidase (beta-lactamase class C family)